MYLTPCLVVEEDESLIDLLIFIDQPLILPQICNDLAARGSVFALPALISKLDFKDRKVIAAINAAIKKIKTRERLTNEALAVLKDPSFRKAKWTKSALHFLAFYSAICSMSDFEIEKLDADEVADLLVNELGIYLDGFTCFRDFRICHLDTERYFDEMQRLQESLTMDATVDGALRMSDINSSKETVLDTYYCELINEFLNVKLIQLYKIRGDAFES